MRRANPRRAIDGAVVGSVATGLAGQLMLVASGILVARALGVEGRGQLAVIVLVPSVLSQLGTLGVPLAVTYYVARDPDGGRRLLRSLAGSVRLARFKKHKRGPKKPSTRPKADPKHPHVSTAKLIAPRVQK